MKIQSLLFDASLDQYQQQVERIFNLCRARDAEVIQLLKERPHFWVKERHDVIAPMTDKDFGEAFTIEDAQLAVARWYAFSDWQRLTEYVAVVTVKDSPIWQFEAAIEAIISGDAETLQQLLSANPDLVTMRSMRMHESTLLIYVGSNGVEGYRQVCPPNIIVIAKILLDAGSDIEAVGTMYWGSTTLGLVATSVHPFLAGVQNDMIDFLLDRGASFAGAVAPDYTRGFLVDACLANGRPEAAEHLAKRGAPLSFESAAGVGRLDIVKSYFDAAGKLKPEITQRQMEQALRNAANCGRIDIAEFLLDRGVDIAASNGQTALHIAAHAGRQEMVKFLISRNAPLQINNEYGGNVLGQALWSAYNASHPDHLAIIEILLAAGADVRQNQQWIDELRRRSAAMNGDNDNK